MCNRCREIIRQAVLSELALSRNPSMPLASLSGSLGWRITVGEHIPGYLEDKASSFNTNAFLFMLTAHRYNSLEVCFPDDDPRLAAESLTSVFSNLQIHLAKPCQLDLWRVFFVRDNHFPPSLASHGTSNLNLDNVGRTKQLCSKYRDYWLSVATAGRFVPAFWNCNLRLGRERVCTHRYIFSMQHI